MISPIPHPPEFAKLVQDALNRLYDSPYLQCHPLTKLLVDAKGSRVESSQDLRRLLLHAIRTRRPQAGTPAQAVDWRYYQILELRYIEGLSPAEVMAQLGLSKSQFFRDQAHILDALVAALWAHYRQTTVGGAATASSTEIGVGAEPRVQRDDLAHAAVERLRTEAKWQSIHVGSLLEELRILVEALAQAKQVKLQFDIRHALAELVVDRVMLRQTLLNVITYALSEIQFSALSVSTFCEAQQTGIAVVATLTAEKSARHKLELRQGMGLHISAELMTAMGGALTVKTTQRGDWTAYLVWPRSVDLIASANRPRSLLVVDDNTEFAHLCRRYLAATQWQVTGAGGGVEARQRINEQLPTVLLLDVMMPTEDGWELLMAFKAERTTQHLPVIVCSVLEEAELATALGANAYLTKPLSQQTLLRALARCCPPDTSPAPTP